MLILCITVWAASPEPDIDQPLARHRSNAPPTSLPTTGTAPLGEDAAPTPAPTGHPTGVAPLDAKVGESRGGSTTILEPLGRWPRRPPRPLDPKRTWMTRLDFTLGPVWRARDVDTQLMTSIEYGRMHGFSGAFHTGIIVAPSRDGLFERDPSVEVLDFPVGFGGIARGKLRNKPLYGSIGMTAGMLVHRASTERGVIRRVSPDLRFPIRLAWTAASLGMSLALEQGVSIIHHSYSRRGVELWGRRAYRIGFVLGLHWDRVVKPAERRSKRGS